MNGVIERLAVTKKKEKRKETLLLKIKRRQQEIRKIKFRPQKKQITERHIKREESELGKWKKSYNLKVQHVRVVKANILSKHIPILQFISLCGQHQSFSI